MLSFSSHLVDLTRIFEILLWIGLLGGGIWLRGRAPGAGGRLILGATLLLFSALLAGLSAALIDVLLSTSEPRYELLFPVQACFRLLRTLLHTVGVALVAWAAASGRRSWYEEELATPLPGEDP